MEKVMMKEIVNHVSEVATKWDVLSAIDYDDQNNWKKAVFVEFPYSFYVTKKDEEHFEFVLKKGEEYKQEDILSQIFRKDEEVTLEKEAWVTLQNALEKNKIKDAIMEKFQNNLPETNHESVKLVTKRIMKSSEEIMSPEWYMFDYLFETKKQNTFNLSYLITTNNKKISVDYVGMDEDEDLIAAGQFLHQFQEQTKEIFSSYEWDIAHYIIENEEVYQKQLETAKEKQFAENILSWHAKESKENHKKEHGYHYVITLPNESGKQIAHTIQKLGIGTVFIKLNDKKPEVLLSLHKSNGAREHAPSFYKSFKTFLENNGLHGKIETSWTLGFLDGTKLKKLDPVLER